MVLASVGAELGEWLAEEPPATRRFIERRLRSAKVQCTKHGALMVYFNKTRRPK